MDSIFAVLGVLGGWIVLQLWLLPRLGVPHPRVSRESKPNQAEDDSIESRKN